MSAKTEAKPEERKCPECGSGQVRRSQMRGFWENGVLRAVGVRAYRCESCDNRYLQIRRDFREERKAGRIEVGENRKKR